MGFSRMNREIGLAAAARRISRIVLISGEAIHARFKSIAIFRLVAKRVPPGKYQAVTKGADQQMIFSEAWRF
jgi:hypothetical protein